MPGVVEHCNHPDPELLVNLRPDVLGHAPAICFSGREKKNILFFHTSTKAMPEILVTTKNGCMSCHKKTCIFNSQNPDNQTHTPMPEYTLVGKLSAEQLAVLGENPPQGSVTALFKSAEGAFHLGIDIKGKPNEFLVDEAYPLTPQAIEKLKTASKK